MLSIEDVANDGDETIPDGDLAGPYLKAHVCCRPRLFLAVTESPVCWTGRTDGARETAAKPGDADRPRSYRAAGQATRPKGGSEPANRRPAEHEDVDGEHSDQHHERAADQCLGERQDRNTAGRASLAVLRFL